MSGVGVFRGRHISKSCHEIRSTDRFRPSKPDFLREEPASWTASVEEAMQANAPTMISLGGATGLMSVIYR